MPHLLAKKPIIVKWIFKINLLNLFSLLEYRKSECRERVENGKQNEETWSRKWKAEWKEEVDATIYHHMDLQQNGTYLEEDLIDSKQPTENKRNIFFALAGVLAHDLMGIQIYDQTF